MKDFSHSKKKTPKKKNLHAEENEGHAGPHLVFAVVTMLHSTSKSKRDRERSGQRRQGQHAGKVYKTKSTKAKASDKKNKTNRHVLMFNR